MKNTGMPARRLTAGCIWNSFKSSGRRHLILTGGRKSGKTTLLGELAGFLGEDRPVWGITTWAEPGKAVYLRDNTTGQTALTGIFDPGLPGPENRMRTVEEGFLGLGLQALSRCVQGKKEWAVIDEIGYLESGCEKYCQAIRDLMEKKRIAAVVRRQSLPFLEELCRRRDVFLVDLDSPFSHLGCVIMASGQGKRFGGNKLMADFGGKPLIQWGLDASEGIFDYRMVVTRHREIEELCRSQRISACFHDLPFRSDTVRLGLEGAPAGLKGILFIPGDQPLLKKETVVSLALCASACPERIWRASWEGQGGSPVLFPAWTFHELRHLTQGQGGSQVIKRHPGCVGLLPVKNPVELMDADRQEDLKRLEKYLRP
ncbi:MAG TPA: NTP transferase domain-containing protein [Candidatus Choladousia intestinigallinarum]|nr:NTP transferase domain-containing protein [Candidatus Choladousia intestinigallinarum]